MCYIVLLLLQNAALKQGKTRVSAQLEVVLRLAKITQELSSQKSALQQAETSPAGMSMLRPKIPASI